ncbi:unnamed protein product [Cylicostephanus goldi]|uniref:Uncharacterized protein n=1 Tax=Cylicostephanus goldi TaxID=71465 RepID=A0A3P6RPF5_CYLGO|nr:unnamed protein product [Cylicostephanus goldi]
MTDATPSGQGAPGDGAPPPNQEGADDKDEKKELESGASGAGSQMGGAPPETGESGAASEGGKKKKKKKSKKKKRKTAHFKQYFSPQSSFLLNNHIRHFRKRGHPYFKVLCIVFSLLSLASLATALTMGALMLNDTAK